MPTLVDLLLAKVRLFLKSSDFKSEFTLNYNHFRSI